MPVLGSHSCQPTPQLSSHPSSTSKGQPGSLHTQAVKRATFCSNQACARCSVLCGTISEHTPPCSTPAGKGRLPRALPAAPSLQCPESTGSLCCSRTSWLPQILTFQREKTNPALLGLLYTTESPSSSL